jgi:hypothetical protein
MTKNGWDIENMHPEWKWERQDREKGLSNGERRTTYTLLTSFYQQCQAAPSDGLITLYVCTLVASSPRGNPTFAGRLVPTFTNTATAKARTMSQ